MEKFGMIIGLVGGVLGLAGIISFTIVYSKGTVAKDTIRLQEKNIKALGERVSILEDNDVFKTKKIGELEGEVKTLKTLPLEQLGKSYAEMATTIAAIGETQHKIMELLAIQSSGNVVNVNSKG